MEAVIALGWPWVKSSAAARYVSEKLNTLDAKVYRGLKDALANSDRGGNPPKGENKGKSVPGLGHVMGDNPTAAEWRRPSPINRGNEAMGPQRKLGEVSTTTSRRK